VGRPELEEAAANDGQGPETGPAGSVEQGKDEGGGCRQERNSSPRGAEQQAPPGLGKQQEEGRIGGEQAEEAGAAEAGGRGGAGSEPRAAASPGGEGPQQETGAGSGSVGVSRSSGAKRARSGTLELDLNAPAGDKAPAEPSVTGSPVSPERHPQVSTGRKGAGREGGGAPGWVSKIGLVRPHLVCTTVVVVQQA
jgi:hypothetical protein